MNLTRYSVPFRLCGPGARMLLLVLASVVLVMAARPRVAVGDNLSQRYLDSIRLSFDEDPRPAMGQLASLHDSERGLEQLRKTANRLAESDPQVLVPLIALEVKLHFFVMGLDTSTVYTMIRAGRKERVLKLLLKLGDDYLAQGEDGEAGPIVSRMLTSTAFHYRDPGYRNPRKLVDALTLLDLALRIDPGNLAARHLQGCIEEKRGRYVRAARSFERLLELDPTCAEARLRIALCLLRDGKEEPAMALLEQVTGSQGPGWVRSLAWQELAQVHALAGERQRAIATVRQGMAQLAADERLQHRLELLLLFLLDDRSPESSALLDTLSDERERPWQASPRVRYNLPPVTLDAMHEQLQQDISKRLPRLEAALEQATELAREDKQEDEQDAGRAAELPPEEATP